MISSKPFLGILRKCLIIGVENMSPTLNEMDRNFVPKNLRKVGCKVFVEKIKELGSKFNSCRATSTNYKGEEPSSFFVRRGW